MRTGILVSTSVHIQGVLNEFKHDLLHLKKNLHLGNEDTPPALKGNSNDYVKIPPLPGVLDGTGKDLQV